MKQTQNKTVKEIKKQRKAFVAACTSHNLCIFHQATGFPLVKKILFLKQLANIKDNYEAWEWNEQKKHFDKL